VITYVWPRLVMTCVPARGVLIVTYDDGAFCRVAGPGPDDHTFGRDLGCTGEQHIRLHELLHQLIGFRYFRSEYGSPVVRREATGEPQPAQGHDEPEEKMCWAVTRMVFGTHHSDPWFEPEWIERLREGGVDVERLVADARWLYEAPERLPPGSCVAVAG